MVFREYLIIFPKWLSSVCAVLLCIYVYTPSNLICCLNIYIYIYIYIKSLKTGWRVDWVGLGWPQKMGEPQVGSYLI